MTMEDDQMYSLSCAICSHPYWSKTQFPEEQVCERCMGNRVYYDSNGISSTDGPITIGGQEQLPEPPALSKKKADPEQWKKDKKARKKARKARKRNRKR